MTKLWDERAQTLMEVLTALCDSALERCMRDFNRSCDTSSPGFRP